MLSGACPGEGRGRSTGAGSASFRRGAPACAGEADFVGDKGFPSPPQAPAQAGAHLWLYPQALQAMAGDGYLPAQVSSERGESV